MTKRLLIDAANSEELRVVVAKEKYIEEFEYQANQKRSTKGNIYLAKITRVEPSLQAAFVDYGSDRHGFLPFSEIHPDYYQIPVSDREQLIEEMRNEYAKRVSDDDDPSTELSDLAVHKRYKIQEVVKKDQVLLVQIEKEERGNKGASITTYISLAGRYCVLMPNATKGGGVSRKIEDDDDRKRLKKVAVELTEELKGKGAVIIRTAGAYKTKTEIKKDLAYLRKLWETVIGHTVKSKAPAFIHEEGDIVIKSIRDLYDGDIDEILISGEKAYEQARGFMKAILPRHVNKVKLHDSHVPLFAKYKLEDKLAELYSPTVTLPSGGYLVINQTEALVAIDVNSGRATSERNVEDTAAKTNIEAAEELARQIRLRDLSGLIVVDFIDMYDLRNKKATEAALRDATANDKAKIHLGRISNFGLLEMSRQRLRPSLSDVNSHVCGHCNGRGRVRNIEATSASMLRAIKSELADETCSELQVSAATNVILYVLNNKRAELVKIEQDFEVKINMLVDESAGGDGFFIEKIKLNKAKKADKNVALSDMEQNFEEPIVDAEPEQAESRGPKKIKFKGKRDHRPIHSDEAVAAVETDSEEVEVDLDLSQEEQPSEQSFDSRKNSKWKKKNFQNNKGGKKFHKSKYKSNDPANVQQSNSRENFEEEIEANNFDAEMAERRKQNQNLLKEIWKKIVD